jgi:hypothetical protein
MQYTLLKLAGLVFFFTVVAPVLVVFVKAKAKQKVYEQMHPKRNKQVMNDVDLNQYQAIKQIYREEREGLYIIARDLFRDNMKAGLMNRMDILTLKQLLNESLGDYIHEFDNYKHVVKQGKKEVIKYGFQNDAHEVYCKMMSYHISPGEWQKIIGYLKGFATEEKVAE